ncbi:MAG: hypothetical protein A2X18_05090 [Bacteroidetes bacterium GWF2_40_14]|nr:MAG: hypothetical protein A2X18_05090 [Bacteroidetes bacterium GWF2_40_14]
MKRNYGVNSRLLLIITITGVLFILVMMALYLSERRSYNIVFDSSQKQLEQEVNALIKISNRTQGDVAWDYTYWDEFVSALKYNDKDWYQENISTIISSFHMDYVSVYDPTLNIIHEASSDDVKIRHFIPDSVFSEFVKSPEISFYIATSEGIFEINGASVHPSNDPTHEATKPSGYLFVAKLWNNRFIEELSNLSGTTISLLEPDNTPAKQDKFMVSTSVNLNGWNGKPIRSIMFTREHEGLKLFKQSSSRMILLLLASIIVSWLLIRFSLIRWVVRPLNLIKSIIATEDLMHVGELRKVPGEFKQIAEIFGLHLRQKEELIAAKEKAEESERLKSSFLTNISHEIRTPMNGIMGFAGLLKEPDLTGEQQQKYIKIIEESGTRMINIINDLVNISKIESGLLDLNITQFNLNELLDYIYAYFKPEVERKGIQLLLDKKLPTNEVTIKSDREKVYSIVTNLVKNASKFTNDGFIKFGFDKVDNELTFFVHDTGIGISSEKQKVIFNRFIQADTSLSKDYEGAGLGLTITKAYVEALGGKIWVKSEPDFGSSFYFTIPCESMPKCEPQTNNPTNKKSGLKSSSMLKVLIAEDDNSSDILLTQFLNEIDADILHARNGKEAIEIFKQNPDIDIILMDIKMPKMDGLEATKEIRSFNEDVIIIAQTAYALSNDREMVITAGCNDHISKPIIKKELFSILSKYAKLAN